MRGKVAYYAFVCYLALSSVCILTTAAGAATCNQTNTDVLDCLACSDASTNKCPNAAGSLNITDWKSETSASGKKNESRWVSQIKVCKHTHYCIISETYEV